MNNKMNLKSDKCKALSYTVLLMVSALLLAPVTMHILNLVLGKIKV
jgi:hypothetical protein